MEESVTSVATTKDKAWSRVMNILSLCLWILDYCTDLYTVIIIYWAEESVGTAVLSTIFAVISGLISLALVPGLGYLVWTGKEYSVKWACYLKYGVAMYGSTPQLCINLYVLSICGRAVHPIQYISAVASFMEILSGILCGDQVFVDQSNEARTWLDRASLTLAKVAACSARIFAAVLYITYEGWWSLFIVLAHALILIPCGILKARKEWRRNEQFVNFLILCKLAFFSVGFMFVWFGDIWDKQRTVAWAVLYYLQSLAMVIPIYSRIYTRPTCLASNFFVSALCILQFCALFAAVNVYVVRRHRKILKHANVVKGNSTA